MADPPLPLFSRLVLAYRAWFRILFDGRWAAQLVALDGPKLPEPPARPAVPSHEPALSLLALLQREGRLLDFLTQDITGFADSEVGAAARIVHSGCRKALNRAVEILPIRVEAEGDVVELPATFDAQAHRLVGSVPSQGPYRGKLRHRGWRAGRVQLEQAAPQADPTVLAQAEIEL